jgi:outer membrane protein insertion porin family
VCQNYQTPGTLVHGGDRSDHGPLTIGRVTAGVEDSRPFRPKWSGTLGLIFQVNYYVYLLSYNFSQAQQNLK